MEPAAQRRIQQATGMEPLPSEQAIRAFDQIVASGVPQALVLHGSQPRIRRLVAAQGNAGIAEDGGDEPGFDTACAGDSAEWQPGSEKMRLRTAAARKTCEQPEHDEDTEWSELGFDSLHATEVSN